MPRPISQTEIARSRRPFAQVLSSSIRAAWNPQPLPVPQVDPDLPHLSFVERCAEVMRYNLLRLEYALSAGGTLREFLKFNCRMAAAMVIPSVFIGGALTIALSMLVSASNLLLAFVTNILMTLLTLIAIVAICSAVLFLIRRGRQ
jgi:hypothetical protein